MPLPLNFVLCPPFHGATLFGLLANNHEKITSLGDTLPERDHMDFYCSCRTSIDKCDFWKSLGRELKASRFQHEQKLLPVVPRMVTSDQKNETTARVLTEIGIKYHFNPWLLRPFRAMVFRAATERLAETACRLQGTQIFLDGAKDYYRAMAYLFIARPKRTRIIHLVRDPRGYAMSSDTNFAENNLRPDHPMVIWNTFHELVMCNTKPFPGVEYIRVRYEDLCADPNLEMNKVFSFLGLEEQDVAHAPTEPHHLIGNRMLYEFDGTVNLDTRWQQQMTASRRIEVLEGTRGLATEFGYV